MSRPIRARLDFAALRHNHSVVRRHVGKARIWSVVKADAYGHGLLATARALADVTDGFALIEPEGALALREAGIRQPILMMEGPYSADDLAVYAQLQVTPALHALWQVEALAHGGLPSRSAVYLKLNTGMNRLGLNPDELPAALTMLDRAGCVAQISLMTHFADADEERGIAEQLLRLQAMTANTRLPMSLANSAAILRFPEAHADWVRPGIMLYGASPFPAMQSAAELDLRPVMTLESELIGVRDIAAGERIGYGGSFAADAAMRIGIVACGYADGYPRHAPTGTPVLVAGQRTRTLGRVSMDKLCVDLSGIPEAALGSRVVLWGEGLPADDVATAAGTVAYELFCALAPRVDIVEQN